MHKIFFPNLIGKDHISLQFRDFAFLQLKMGGRPIQLPSDYEKFLEWSFKTSSVLDTYHPLTSISEQEKNYTKIKTFNIERTNQRRTIISNNLSDSEKYALELASQKGASLINSTSINPNFGMGFISDMDRNQLIFHSHEQMVNFFTLPTLFTVKRVDTPT